MTKTLYIGDIHGSWDVLEILVKTAMLRHPDIKRVVQVGDAGFWPRMSIKYWYSHSSVPVPVFFIDGNHEDHFTLLQNMTTEPAVRHPAYTGALHIPRGFYHDKILYMGGASSIDKDYRTPGHDWFPDESISQKDFETACLNSGNQIVNVMVCHDTTKRGFGYMTPFLFGGGLKSCGETDRIALEELFIRAKPKLYIHGHYHGSRHYEIEGCLFIVLKNPDSMQNEIISSFKSGGGPALKKALDECTIVADENGNIYTDVSR